MSSKCAPTKITDSDKTKMGQENVCRHFKVGYCKYETKCRHKHIYEEYQAKSCEKDENKAKAISAELLKSNLKKKWKKKSSYYFSAANLSQ